MNPKSSSLARCQAFIDSNFVNTPDLDRPPPRALTISRQSFSRSHEMAEALIRLLDRDDSVGDASWVLFDKDLVHKILEDHHLPKRIARYMPEDRDHDFSGLLNEILGLHPSLWELFHHTCDTIRKLAHVGNVILIGRGSHIITRDLPHVFHVRAVAPFNLRVQNAATKLDISEQQASKRLQKEDQASVAYIKSHFNEAHDNPLSYHLTINLGKLGPEAGARLVHQAMKST